MQKLIAAMLMAVAMSHRSDPVLVKAVPNGDTIAVAPFGTVTLLGIDARAADARDRLASLVLSRWVRLEFDDDPRSHAGRRRAYVFTDLNEFVNATLVREGLARVARGQFARRAELERAEAEARALRRGIWARYTRVRP